MRVMKRFHSNTRPMGFDDDYSGKSMSGGGGYRIKFMYGHTHANILFYIYIMSDTYTRLGIKNYTVEQV